MKRAVLAWLVAVLAAGCRPDQPGPPPWLFEQTGPSVAAQEPSCAVRLYLSPPSAPYDELGVVMYQYDASYAPTDAGTFLAQVGDVVCAAGGNTVIASTQLVTSDDYCSSSTSCSHHSWVAYVQGVVIREPAIPP